MSKKLIEMVCTGNQGRSPVAELVAQNYLRNIGTHEYAAISSGTNVDEIKQGRLSTDFMVGMIKVAQERELYTAAELEMLQYAVQNDDTDKVKVLFAKAERTFVSEERKYRLEVLPELGIEGTLKENQEQTRVRTETAAVFSMAQNNNKAVERIYDGLSSKPLIAVLSAYAFDDLTAQIPNAFGKSKEIYIAAVQAIQIAVPKAINNLLV